MDNKNGTNIHLTERFPAGKEVLYNAWTDPAELKQWWKPMGHQLQNVENNITEGGKVSYAFEDDLNIEGSYKEVQKGEKLVYSWNWSMPEESPHKGDYLLTVEFKPDGDGSTLEVTQENFKNEHAIKPHREGWEASLKDLKTYLQNRAQK